VDDIGEIIRSTGFFNNKSRNIKACAMTLVDEYDGQVPKNLDALVKLPGVGRKTANVVLGTGFGVPGIVVDTHVIRIANLLDLTRQKDAVKIEHELEKILDQQDWVMFTHMIIDHGRAVCIARRPQCHVCVLSDLCPSVLLEDQVRKKKA
jgi:endonuclease-3